MNNDKILKRFCRRLVALDMDIFGLRKKQAQDAEKPEWITMNGTHIHVGKGETPKEAGKRFVAKKEAEKTSRNGKSSPDIENKKSKLIDYYKNIIKSGTNSKERDSIMNQQIELLKNAKTDNDITKAVQWEQYADKEDFDTYAGMNTKQFYELGEKADTTSSQSKIDALSKKFWTKKDEMKSDFEDAGFTVHEINDEYAVLEDKDGKTHKLEIGNPGRTMFIKAKNKTWAKIPDNDWEHPDTFGIGKKDSDQDENWTHSDTFGVGKENYSNRNRI